MVLKLAAELRGEFLRRRAVNKLPWSGSRVPEPPGVDEGVPAAPEAPSKTSFGGAGLA